MAVLLERVDGEARYIQLKQATSPGTLPPGSEFSPIQITQL